MNSEVNCDGQIVLEGIRRAKNACASFDEISKFFAMTKCQRQNEVSRVVTETIDAGIHAGYIIAIDGKYALNTVPEVVTPQINTITGMIPMGQNLNASNYMGTGGTTFISNHTQQAASTVLSGFSNSNGNVNAHNNYINGNKGSGNSNGNDNDTGDNIGNNVANGIGNSNGNIYSDIINCSTCSTIKMDVDVNFNAVQTAQDNNDNTGAVIPTGSITGGSVSVNSTISNLKPTTNANNKSKFGISTLNFDEMQESGISDSEFELSNTDTETDSDLDDY